MSKEIKGSCMCGAVQVAVTGAPDAAGYCHCESCRAWGAAPFSAYAFWKPENVKITKGESNLLVYAKTETSQRKSCKTCGGHVLTAHPPWENVEVYPAVLQGFKFEPTLHCFYSEKMVAFRDGLPKYKDSPTDMGGSGELIPE